jgi:Putative carbonic anhydrase
MTDGRFATAINCMDGRVQMPIIDWLKKQYGVDYVDMVTEPGPERVLAEGKDRRGIQSIRKRLEISVARHNSRLTAIVCHHGCAGNPTDKETQLKQLYIAGKTVASWNLGVRIVGLWIDDRWEVQKVFT